MIPVFHAATGVGPALPGSNPGTPVLPALQTTPTSSLKTHKPPRLTAKTSPGPSALCPLPRPPPELIALCRCDVATRCNYENCKNDYVVVSEAANGGLCFYFAANNAFNFFFGGKPVWQIAKALLIITLCTECLKHRGRAMKGSRFCSRQLESSANTRASFLKSRGNCEENAVRFRF